MKRKTEKARADADPLRATSTKVTEEPRPGRHDWRPGALAVASGRPGRPQISHLDGRRYVQLRRHRRSGLPRLGQTAPAHGRLGGRRRVRRRGRRAAEGHARALRPKVSQRDQSAEAQGRPAAAAAAAAGWRRRHQRRRDSARRRAVALAVAGLRQQVRQPGPEPWPAGNGRAIALTGAGPRQPFLRQQQQQISLLVACLSDALQPGRALDSGSECGSPAASETADQFLYSPSHSDVFKALLALLQLKVNLEI